MSEYAIETHYRVYDNTHGGCVNVTPDRDGLGCVEVWTEGKGEENFGAVRLVLQPAMALVLADALKRCATDHGVKP